MPINLPKAVNQRLRRAYRFFHAHGGYIMGERAMTAIAYARAEAYASANGWRYLWEDDYDEGPAGWGWPKAEVAKWRRDTHKCECCVLVAPTEEDDHGEEQFDILASLCGIWDADTNYRRVVEAELALEAMRHIERQTGEPLLTAGRERIAA